MQPLEIGPNAPFAKHSRDGEPDQPAAHDVDTVVSESDVGQMALPSVTLAHWLRVHGLVIDDDH